MRKDRTIHSIYTHSTASSIMICALYIIIKPYVHPPLHVHVDHVVSVSLRTIHRMVLKLSN